MQDAMWLAQVAAVQPQNFVRFNIPSKLFREFQGMSRFGKALCRTEIGAFIRLYRNRNSSKCPPRDVLEYGGVSFIFPELRECGRGNCEPRKRGLGFLKDFRSQKNGGRPGSVCESTSFFHRSLPGLCVDLPAIKSSENRVENSVVFSCPLVTYRGNQHANHANFCSGVLSTGFETVQVGRTTRRKAVSNQASVETDASKLLKEGALLEVDKEPGRTLLAVAQKRDGKKNWIAEDQFGNMFSVKPQQITYIVPGLENFEASSIHAFVQQVERLADTSLLEMAWEEILALDTTISASDLAKILYVGANPVECYAAHQMLASGQVFFRCRQKGFSSVYEPRSSAEVNELLEQKLVEQAQRSEFMAYVESVKKVMEQPLGGKIPPTIWETNERYQSFNEALKSFALESSRLTSAQKKKAEEVLVALGMPRRPNSAVGLLVGMGIFPVYVNLELLKSATRVAFSSELVAAANAITSEDCIDSNSANRVDLRHLKVYTIDSEDTVEIDDGLSAMRLPDGNLKVWIHVADPTRWLSHDHPLTKEARYRSTSIYLPTETIPMFPMNLAAGPMSLIQGKECCALTFSVVLRDDGSVADYDVVNSTICPTHRMSYENVTELLSLNLEEENELYLLAEAAKLRSKWRKFHGSIDVDVPESYIKVTNADGLEPIIYLSVVDHSLPAYQLVTEMMILCGEVASAFGGRHSLALPYRGQTAREIPKAEIEILPEGPCRAMALLRFLGRAEVNYNRPVPHASLGLPGYVQVTSPIRRYGDLLAHYQIKAVLRGETPPFRGPDIEAAMLMTSMSIREAKRLQAAAKRYWSLEFLRRLPKHTQLEALVLRVGKDSEVLVLLVQSAIQCYLGVTGNTKVGDKIFVWVDRVDPRRDTLDLRQAPS